MGQCSESPWTGHDGKDGREIFTRSGKWNSPREEAGVPLNKNTRAHRENMKTPHRRAWRDATKVLTTSLKPLIYFGMN